MRCRVGCCCSLSLWREGIANRPFSLLILVRTVPKEPAADLNWVVRCESPSLSLLNGEFTMASMTFNPAAFTKAQLSKMLDNPALADFHPSIVAHISGVPATTPKSTPKKSPKVKAKTKPAEKEYSVDEGKVETEIGYTNVSSYSAGYLRLKPKNKNGVVILRASEIKQLEAFISANRDRFTDKS